MPPFQIISSDCGAGAALLKLLKLLQDALALFLMAGARQHDAQIVQRSFVVRLRLDRFAKSGNRFGVFFLLRKDLPDVNV